MSKALIYCLLLLSLGCWSCSGNQQPKEPVETDPYLAQTVDIDLQQIQERGTLRVIVDNSTTSYFIYRGQPLGYEYELLNILAKDLGVKLEIVITTDLNEAYEQLNNGEGDVIAHSLTVTKERQKHLAFTKDLMLVRQMLIQRKPKGWRMANPYNTEKKMVRKAVDLIDKQVYVKKSSSFVDRLQNLEEEIGGEIDIIEEDGSVDTETLIRRVLAGEISYTVADEHVALVNATYYPDLDVKTSLSVKQRIAWAVRKKSPQLLDALDSWIADIRHSDLNAVIYNKYFRNSKAVLQRVKSDYSSIAGGSISPYDDQLKLAADTLNWDWRLLASLVYHESRFQTDLVSWAGAKGLMQLMPVTGANFGATDLFDPNQSIKAGTGYLLWLDKLWKEKVPDKGERAKFILASFNIGHGHVLDAYRLAEKFEANPQLWEENSAKYLALKSQRKYFSDPAAKLGYCRGGLAVKYVEEVVSLFNEYKLLIKDEETS